MSSLSIYEIIDKCFDGSNVFDGTKCDLSEEEIFDALQFSAFKKIKNNLSVILFHCKQDEEPKVKAEDYLLVWRVQRKIQ